MNASASLAVLAGMDSVPLLLEVATSRLAFWKQQPQPQMPRTWQQ